jgi:hypothetical protein
VEVNSASRDQSWFVRTVFPSKMRAAVASNLAGNALVRKTQVKPVSDDKAFESFSSKDNYSSQRAVDAIEVPSDPE